MKNFIKAALDSCIAELSLHAAEANRMITRVEAAAVDQFQIDLMAATNSEEQREKVREAAIALMQLGVSGHQDVQEMVQVYSAAQIHDVTLLDIREIGMIKRRSRRPKD